jgi:hypothetical protein
MSGYGREEPVSEAVEVLLPERFRFLTSAEWPTARHRTALSPGAAKFIVRAIDPQDLLKEIESVLQEHPGDVPDILLQ